MQSVFYTSWLPLFFEFTKREIAIRYKRTIFGFLWMFLNPLLQMAIIGFIFGSLIPQPESISNYFVFIFLGLLVWNFFTQTILKNTSIYVHERILLQKSAFPREILACAVIAANFFHFFISLLLFVIYLLIQSMYQNQWEMIVHLLYTVPFFVLALLWLLLLTTGISLLLATLNVRYRDVAFFMSAVMSLWFYASPIIWELKSLNPSWQLLLYLNPLTGVLEVLRLNLLSIPPTNMWGILLSLSITLGIAVIGVGIFRKEQGYFDDWL